MKDTGRIRAVAAALGILILILDAKTALTGASEGMNLCIKAVIPSLFPFFMLSTLLTDSISGRSFRILNPLGLLTGIPSGGEILLLTGLLGGYPVGARCVSRSVREQILPPEDGRRMLVICNNPGPSFLFGITAGLFPDPFYAWILWAVLILSTLITGALLPGKSANTIKAAGFAKMDISGILRSALVSMASVCGWVILFRVLLAFLNRWVFWLVPTEFQAVFTGILELTNGCLALSGIPSVGLRFILAAGMLSFGGLCVTMQTFSESRNVDMGFYFPGKCLQTWLSLLLAILVQYFFPTGHRLAVPPYLPAVMLIPLLFLLIFWRIRKNSSSIPEKAIV